MDKAAIQPVEGINWRKKNPQELVELEDRWGRAVYVNRRDLVLASQKWRPPLLQLYTKDGEEVEDEPVIHIDNLRLKHTNAGHKALEKIFPAVDFISLSASANEDGCLIDAKMADNLLLLVVRGLVACEKERQDRKGTKANGKENKS